MKLYLLYHIRWIDDNFYDTKIIGIYSSYEKATNTINRYLHLPGFSEFHTGFHIDSFDILVQKIPIGNKKNDMVYLLEGVCFVDLDELVVSYGIYLNRIAALWASIVKKIRRNKQDVKKFYIEKYIIDEDNWKEGFVVMEN